MTDAEQVIHGREEAIICMVENAGALMERIGAMASSLRRERERLRSSEMERHNLIRKVPDFRADAVFPAVACTKRSNGKERPSIQSLVWRLVNAKGEDKPIIALDLSAPGNEAEINEITAEFGEGDEESFRITDSLQRRIIKHIVDTLVRFGEVPEAGFLRQV